MRLAQDGKTSLRALLGASLLVAAAVASASELAQAVDRLVAQGYEDPQGAKTGLQALQATTPATPDNTRALLVGFGLVAADNYMPIETAAAARELRALAATAGPIAEADAHLVNADLEFGGMQEENGNVEARAAVAAYAPYCEAGDPALAARCDRYNWFHALMFAAYGAQGERNTAAAAIYLHMALDASVQSGNRRLQTKATAILALLAQDDKDAELAERLIARAQALADQEDDPALKAYVKSFTGDVLDSREQYEAARTAYREAIAICEAAGLHRRATQYAISLGAEELRLDHPAEALTSLDRAQAFLSTHKEPGLERERLHDQTLALLALGRVAEAKVKLHEVLARYDRETGPNARIGVLRELGPALARAGDRAGALELYLRAQRLLQARSDTRYDRDMQDVQKLIKDENDRLQARRAAEWGGAAAACILLALAVGFIARRQSTRNRQLARRNDALRQQVEHDPLTSLANRAHLKARVARAGAPFEGALFLIDADHFKSINDRYGHAAGDRVLVAIARRLEAVLRERDLVVRWGGEEFLVMVETMPVAEAVVLARRLMTAFVESPVVVDGQEIAISASIGFAVFPLPGLSPGLAFDTAFALVDAAMYHSKNLGRACATCIQQLDSTLALEASTLPATLAQAAADGRAILEVHRPAETVSPA
ncbi:MAG: diguanylate cyclase domain-containing protein [Vitreoscilla sp.]